MKRMMKGLCVLGCVFGLSSAFASNNASVKELFVISAEHANVSQDKTGTYQIVLQYPEIGYFTDRPVRQAGRVPVPKFVTEWTQGEDSFAKDNPNAALSAGFATHTATEQAPQYVELSAPSYDAKKHTLTFTLHALNDETSIVVGEYVRPMMFIDNFQVCNGSHHSAHGCL